jgi:Fur family transcriptional regulator, ferric uptake regulator
VTVSPGAQRAQFDDLPGAVRALRERGLRLSTSRRLVLEALFQAEGAVSAETVASRVGIDAGSVYRNLEALEQHGLVRHVHFGHGPGLYVLIGGGEHEYLYCESCGAVRTLSSEELGPLREEFRDRFGYDVRFSHFPVVGTCAACTGKPAEEPSHGDDLLHSHGGFVHAHPHAHGAQPARHDHDGQLSPPLR